MNCKVLTVSVAAFNVQDYIEECLRPFTQESAAERCEVLIIDDGATDKTYEIAERFEKEFPKTFKVIHKENGGWGSTVNCGIQLASGKYFKQLDGDDYFDIKGLISFLDALQKTESDIVLSPFVTFVSDTKQVVGKKEPSEKFKTDTYKEYNLNELNQSVNIAMHQCAFKTSILKNNNISLLEHAFYTDVELVIKALCSSNTVTFVPMTVYCYRTQRAGQSMSIDGISKHYKEHEQVVFRIAAFLREKKNAPGYGLACKRFKSMIIFQYRIYSNLKPSVQLFREVRAFDHTMRRKFPEFYQVNSRRIRVMRMTGFIVRIPLNLNSF